MLPARKAALLASLCCPLLAHGQMPTAELPLPRTDGPCLVLKIRYDFPWKPGGLAPATDTVGVFLAGPDGLLRTAYFCHAGVCTGKETYQYEGGLLVRKTGYTSISIHPPFARSAQHRHRLAFEKKWRYRDGKLISMESSAGPDRTPTLATTYAYDVQGRLTEEHSKYFPQSIVQFSTRYDEVSYDYDGDSVRRMSFEHGLLRDSANYLARLDSARRLRERWEILPGGKHFRHEHFQYDTAGRLCVYQCSRERSPLRSDGSVDYADRIERSYDERGRLVDQRFFAREIKRWEFRYVYQE